MNKEIIENRMERKKEETKQKIINTAMQLFKEQGVEATTMEQIAKEVDIAKGTLYNYFNVKEAIIDEYMKRSFTEKNSQRILALSKLPDTRTRLIVIFSELIKGIELYKDIFEKYLIYRMQLMLSLHPDDSERSGFNHLAMKIIELGQQEGEIRDDLPLYVLKEFFEFSLIEAVKRVYLEPGYRLTPEDLERYVDLCINGIKGQSKN